MKKLLFHCLDSSLFKILVFVFLLLPFTLFSFLGCGLIGGMFNTPSNSSIEKTDVNNSNQGENNSTGETLQGENDGSKEKESDQNQTAETSSSETSVAKTTTEMVESTIKIKAYYVDDQAQYLIGEERTISGKYIEDYINAAFYELMKKPSSGNVYNLIPEGTKILSAEYIDRYAYLNLSKEFVTNKSTDGIVDYLVINCIADTITEIPNIDGVLFKVDLKKLDLYGTLDIKSPVKRNEDIIKK